MTIKVNFNDTKFTVTKKRRTTDLKALALTRVKIRINSSQVSLLFRIPKKISLKEAQQYFKTSKSKIRGNYYEVFILRTIYRK